jgi:adenosine deaminase
MTRNISGPSSIALASLTPGQIAFIKSLPKAELHAHLNGCIPLSCLQELIRLATLDPSQVVAIREVLGRLQSSAEFDDIDEVFELFPAIYTLTATPETLAFATRAVLKDFLEGDDRQCSHLELRTTPRRTKHMSRLEYLETVLSEVEKYSADEAALIVSIDRRMSVEEVEECVDTAIRLKRRGRRVVGMDLCGDPKVFHVQICWWRLLT